MPAIRSCPAVRFTSAAGFRRWLERHHSSVTELTVAFWNKTAGRPGLTYSDALDEALCFGWIDGIRHKVDEHSYTIRFTPRQRRSQWSLVNLRRVEALLTAGRMASPGLVAHEARDPARVARGSYEQKTVVLPPELAHRFAAETAAWNFFATQAPYYRRVATWWVVSAKREDTRLRRLATLIADSAAGRQIAQLTPKGSRSAQA